MTRACAAATRRVQRAPSRLCLIAIVGLLPAAADAAARPTLRTIRQIRALSPEDGASGHPVHIRGVVTHFDERGWAGLIVHDGHAGQFVMDSEKYIPSHHPSIQIRVGDIVEVEGETVQGGFAPDVRPRSLRRIGRGTLPPPRHLSLPALLTGRYDCEYVEVVGVGQRAWLGTPQRTMFLDVAVAGGTLRATFWDYSPGDLARFIDARVRLRGTVGTLFSQAGQLRGVALFAGRTRDVAVEQPPPEPSTLPLRSIASLAKYSVASGLSRRVRVQGVVTCEIRGRPVDVTDDSTSLRFRHVSHVVYVRDETSGARVETEQDVDLSPATRVDVVGFPVVTPGRPMLRHAIVRPLGVALEAGPAPLAAESAPSPDRDAELVRVEGRVLGLVPGPAERIVVIRAGETVFEAALDASSGQAALPELRPGSVVSATGVYAYQAGPPPSFRVLMRSPRDLALVSAPAWWTLGHTLVTLAIVGLVALASTLWVRAIARKNVVIRAQWQAILSERGRLARELHDTLEQGLAGVKLQIEAVAGSLPGSPPRARLSLEVAQQMLRYCLDEARRAIMDLRSQALDQGDLAQALTRMARQMTVGSPLVAEVRVLGSPRRLDAPQEHHLLRIGLEALTNAVKHSRARRVEIELRFEPERTQLTVRDDGRGFGVDTDGPGGHFGLRGIRERVDKMGGTLRVESRGGGGAEIAVTLPCGPQATHPASELEA